MCQNFQYFSEHIFSCYSTYLHTHVRVSKKTVVICMTFMNFMTVIIFGFFYVVLAWCSGLFYQKNSWQAWSVIRLATWQVSNDDLLPSSVSHIRRSWLSCQGVAMLAMCTKSRYCAKVTSPTANIGKDKSKWKHSMTPICESYMVFFATMAALWMKQTNSQEKGHLSIDDLVVYYHQGALRWLFTYDKYPTLPQIL